MDEEKEDIILSMRKHRVSINVSVLFLLLGGILGAGAIVFAVASLSSLYRHTLPPVMNLPEYQHLGQMITARLSDIAHAEADLRNTANIEGILKPYSDNVFIDNVLVCDPKGQTVYYQMYGGETERAEAMAHLRDCGLQDEAAWDESRLTEKSDLLLLCYKGAVRNKKGDTIGMVIYSRSIPPIPEKLAAGRQRMLTDGLLALGALAAALFIVLFTAFRLVRRNTAARLKNERLAALNTIATGLAHEIRNPLNAIALTSQYLQKLMRPKQERSDQAICDTHSEIEKNLGVFHEEINSVKRIINDFLDSIRPVRLQKGETTLRTMLEHVAMVFEQELSNHSVTLKMNMTDGEVRMFVDRAKMQQVFSNLIKNSMEAMEKGGALTITAGAKRDMAEVRFADTGPGVPAAKIPLIFEPYFTTKKGGQGLGLAISRNIIEAHGGTIAVEPHAGAGAVFTVTVPLFPTEADAAENTLS